MFATGKAMAVRTFGQPRPRACLSGQRLRSSRGFVVPGRKGRSPDAVASGQGASVPGAEKHRWADPVPTQTGSEPHPFQGVRLHSSFGE